MPPVSKGTSLEVISVVGWWDSKAYLSTVNVEVSQLAKGSQSASEVGLLDLLRHVLDIAHGALLLGSIGRHRLGSVLALGIRTGGLPSGSLLSLSISSGSSGSRSRSRSCRRSASSSSSSSSAGLSCRGGGRGGGGSVLACSGRSGGLGERHNWSGAGSGSGTASPSHGLRRSSRLDGSSFGLGNRLDGGSRSRLLGELSEILGFLFRSLLGSSFGVNGGGLFRLSLGGLCGNSRLLGIGTIDLGSLLELLVHLIGIDSLRLVLLLDGLGLGSSRSLCGGHFGLGSRGLQLGFGRLFFLVFADVPEDVIEDEVAGRLLGKHKGLNEFLRLSRLV
jgi:hypothetical protein